MNKSISLLLLCLLSLPAMLTAQNRRAPDACPGMNNKKPTGDYAALSKRSGQNSSFSTPKYQHLYAKSRYAVTASAATKEKNPSSSTRSAGKEKEEPEFTKPAEPVKPAEKNSSS